MPTREQLHKLIDSLPEGSWEPANQLLSNLQTWPPPALPDMAAMRKKHADHREEMRQKMIAHQRPGTIGGFGASGNYNPATGSGSYGMSQWEGDTFVVQTYRQHQGHELIVIERIRIDGRQLIYKHEVTGPGPKHHESDVTFEIGA